MPDNTENKPKVGVFICHCGGNISDVVDVKKVAEELKKVDGVTLSTDYVFMCSDPGQNLIYDALKKGEIDRVVVAACSPKLHELTFRRKIIAAGVNPFLLEQANIREQDSWVHHSDKEGATEKAIKLVKAAVEKIKLAKPLDTIKVESIGEAIIIGGGIAGIRAAVDLAEKGVKVHLIEKTPFLGGNVVKLDKLYPTEEESKEIVKDGKAKRKNIPDVQMFKCKKCGKKFCERVNTPFYRKKYSEGLIVGVAWFFYERGSINWVVNKFSIEPTYKTIYGWIAELTEYIARIKGEFEIGKCQGDEMFFNACGKRFYICGIWKDGKIFTMPMLGNSNLELYIVLRNAEINLGEIDELHTDAWDGYKNVTKWLGIKHRYVNRSKEGFVSKDGVHTNNLECEWSLLRRWLETARGYKKEECPETDLQYLSCLLYTSPSPRDLSTPRMPSSA